MKNLIQITDLMYLEKWLTSRTEYYGIWTAIFFLLYAATLFTFQSPSNFWIVVTAAFLLKDIYDEYRIRNGKGSLAHADIEHNPSNIVILLFLLTETVEPGKIILELPKTSLLLFLALSDLILDGSQDLREMK